MINYTSNNHTLDQSKSPLKRVFLKNAHTFSDKKFLLPSLKKRRFKESDQEKIKKLAEKLKSRK